MFKYESGQLPDALNMFFVKNRSVHNYNTRNKDKLRPTVAKHAYRGPRLLTCWCTCLELYSCQFKN